MLALVRVLVNRNLHELQNMNISLLGHLVSGSNFAVQTMTLHPMKLRRTLHDIN